MGVWKGRFSQAILQHFPHVHMTLVDPWDGSDGGGVTDGTPALLDRVKQEALLNLSPFRDRVTILQCSSEDGAGMVPDGSLDFAFIDARHDYPNVRADVRLWYPKVKPGGIVSGHDYIRRSRPTATHVVQAVQGYVYCYGIKPWFLLGSNAKVLGEIRDNSRSWFWVRL